MRAVDGLLEVLQDEGIQHVFGNPGTTELPFVDALDAAGVPYVLAPHEGPLVSMADGYARATRRTSFVSLHIAAGLANGLIGMLNATRSRTPMVITVGQQDRRHLVQDPMLSGDLVGLATAASKHAIEVHRADDLTVVMRRAFRLAESPPAGPVVVSIPMDLLDEQIYEPIPRRTLVERSYVAAGVPEAAAVLRGAARLAIVAGDGVGRSAATASLLRVCEFLGATVYHQPMYDHLDFPLDHPQYAGMLPPENSAIRKTLDEHDVVFLVGVRAFSAHHYTPAAALAADAVVVQLDDDATQLGRTYAATVALLGAIESTLAALAEALGAPPGSHTTVSCEPGALPVERSTDKQGILTPVAAAAAFASSLPVGAIVVEEAITTGLLIRERLRLREHGSFQHTVGGGLGWGIGASVGVALGRPDRPVVAALGDGCALFGVQGLWTAARMQTPTTFVVFNNSEYRTLKQTTTSLRGGRNGGFPGMDLAPPHVRWPQLAQSFGVDGVVAASPDELSATLADRSAADGPLLVEVPIHGFDGAGQ